MESASQVRHVLVVGGGLAGLTAALEVIKNKGRVTLLEKCAKLGGNSAKASSGINGAGELPEKPPCHGRH
jgi:succinate dehydrogenase/fumarate reductase flavoprotein subunit